MAAQAAAMLASHLEDGERYISDGLAVWVQEAERLGRGAGEGRIYLTDRRIFFWDDGGSAPRWMLPISDIEAVRDHWIVAPGMRALVLRTMGREVSFYAAKRFVKEAAAALSWR